VDLGPLRNGGSAYSLFSNGPLEEFGSW